MSIGIYEKDASGHSFYQGQKQRTNNKKSLIPHQTNLQLKYHTLEEQFQLIQNSDPSALISTWNTEITNTYTSNSTSIKLPLHENGTYDFTVDWGDNSNDTITKWNQTEVVKVYTNPGIYVVTINGTIDGWVFFRSIYGKSDDVKLLEINQWGNLSLGNTGHYFWGCENLKIPALDVPDLNGTTTMIGVFGGAANLEISSVNHWNTSLVTNMAGMFEYATHFNQSLESWDVSHVKNMAAMFMDASDFNQPLNSWNISQVTNIDSMFSKAKAFNQPIDKWDVSNVTDMTRMFQESNFNQPIGNWNVTSVVSMNNMFQQAENFNQPLDKWDVSNIRSMASMFQDAVSFNQSLDSWDVSHVEDFRYMFNFDISFDQSLGKWNVSNGKNMKGMFMNASLSPSNYDDMLISWAKLQLQENVTFDAGGSQYSTQLAKENRQFIIDTYNWQITDGGQYIPENTSTNNSNSTDNLNKSIEKPFKLDIIPFTFVLSALMMLSLSKKQNNKAEKV